MKKFIATVAAVCVGLLIFNCISSLFTKDEPNYPSFKEEEIRKIGKLATAEYEFTEEFRFEDDGIFILNKGDFTLEYSAIVKAEIDFEKIDAGKIDHEEKSVEIFVPHATISNEVYIDENSVKRTEKSITFTNFDLEKNLKTARIQAIEHAKAHARETTLLQEADQNAEDLIIDEMKKILPEYTVEVKFI